MSKCLSSLQNECASIIQRAWRRLISKRLEFQVIWYSNDSIITVLHGKLNHFISWSDFSCIKWWDYFKIKKGGGFQRLALKHLFQDVYNEFALKEIQIESGIFHSMYTGLQLYNSSNVLMVTSHHNHNENK